MSGLAHLRGRGGRSNPSSTTTTNSTTCPLLRPPSVVLRGHTVATNATRRDLMMLGTAGLAGVALLPTQPASAAAVAEQDAAAVAPTATTTTATTATTTTTPTTYSDSADGFSLTVPAGWASGEGSLSGNTSFSGSSGSRRAVAFFDTADPQTNVVVVVGNTSPEFTKMSSFGTPTTFGSALVNSMDRGFLLRAPAWVRAREAGPGGAVQVARLEDCKEVAVAGADGDGKGYLTDYTISLVTVDEATKAQTTGLKRRLLSVAALHTMSSPGRGSLHRILTVTAQTTATDDEAKVAALRKIVDSFRIA
jgi:hypothetical protein